MLDPEDYDSQSTVADLKDRIRQLQASGIGFIQDTIVEQEDGDSAYVLTPLYDSEQDQLMKNG